MKIQIFLLTAITILLAACGPSEQERAQQEQREQQLQMQMIQTSPEFDEAMGSVLDRYFELKDALVETDAERAATAAELLKNEALSVEQLNVNDETMALWIAFREVISGNAEEITQKENVDDQRYHFEYISDSMIEMVDHFEPVDFVLYHQSCPMVRGGTAEWLSREEQIRNPYHGERMMNCGETIRRINSEL